VTETSGRRRRPSGDPPPLPRPAWWPKLAIALAVTIVVGVVIGFLYAGDPLDRALLEALTGFRDDWIVNLSKALSWFASAAGIITLRLVLAVVLIIFRRWRHLAVTVGAFAIFDALVIPLVRTELPAPSVDVILVPPSGVYYFPASDVASLTITLGAMVASLAPSGRIQRRALIAALAFAVLVSLARSILGTTYPLAGLYSILLGFTTAWVVFGWLAPPESFPVSYRRGGKAAHLDLSGAREQAVVTAMRDQLGLEIVQVKSFGEEGSGGSTPLLMTTADGRRIFGKILATSHVRSDRWYRIGRTIMYGRLEDETSFSSVRRLILAEDHALRLLDDLGFKVAHSYGVVELTPHQEYLLPTEFFEGAETLGHAEVRDEVIDDGISLVRRLWDTGLAHRDIKPANLLVVDGRLQVIDVSGLEVRPSPWRQAVDLANMMLVLALRSDPDRVYERALRSFTPEDIAEAFAATRGIAIPTELQGHLKEDDRDLVGRFKELAPPHPEISIQRWSFRRVALTVATLVGVVLTAVLAVSAYFNVLD
jgi:membrane-associated phospholipid phosphatase